MALFFLSGYAPEVFDAVIAATEPIPAEPGDSSHRNAAGPACRAASKLDDEGELRAGVSPAVIAVYPP
jgi:hypothetical protein